MYIMYYFCFIVFIPSHDIQQSKEKTHMVQHSFFQTSQVEDIADSVKKALIESLDNSTHWMSPGTRLTAISKVCCLYGVDWFGVVCSLCGLVWGSLYFVWTGLA